MMDEGIKKTVEVPEGVDFSLDGSTLKVSGPNGELSRVFNLRGVRLDEDEKGVTIETDSSRRKRRASVGTVVSHIRNMVKGVTEGFSSELKVVYSHFPISVSEDGNRVKIENFLGEEKPRFADIVGDSKVSVRGDEIEVVGPNKEDVGQTAANIEQTAQVKNRDPRVFQDGIYIVKRP